MILKLHKFVRNQSGSLSVETVLIFPILVWMFLAMLVFWDGFRLKNDALTATYAIGDLVSRQTGDVTDHFVLGVNSVFAQLTTRASDADARISVVQRQEGPDPDIDDDFNELVWSVGLEDMPGRQSMAELNEIIPLMAVGSTLIVVETRTRWSPPWTGVLPDYTFDHIAFVRPRYIAQVNYTGTLNAAGAGG